jgi:2-hydroxychromene-2-carboxylate isomerase
VDAKLDAAKARSADANCPGPSKPASAAPDPNNPKVTALNNMASSLGITVQQLQQAFDSAASHGVTTLDDPRMASAVASAAGLDAGAVQQALGQVIATIQQANAQHSG